MEVREGCGPLELTRGRRGRIPLRTTLSQIPLKSCGFPGAESARKRFFLRGASTHSEKISARGDQAKSLISLGRSQSDLPALWASNLSAAQVAGLDWKSRGFTPSRALPRGWFDESSGFRRRGAWGALLPCTPSGMGCERGTPLSRSPPGAVLSVKVCQRRNRWGGSDDGFFCRRSGLEIVLAAWVVAVETGSKAFCR